MPIDATNYGSEIKKLRAELSEMRAEVAFMYSALQNIQEQFGFALAEINNSVKNLSGEIQNSVCAELENSAEKFFNSDLMTENFSRLEKVSETQQLNFRNYFDRIENSLSAQQKMFGETFAEKISNVGENVSIVQKNMQKLSSEVDEIISAQNKMLIKKIDSLEKQQKDFYKTLGTFEELLRIVAANQMLGEVEKNLPTHRFKKFENEIQNLNKNFYALEELLRILAANQMLGEVEKNLPKTYSVPKSNFAEQKNISSSKNSGESSRFSRINEIFERGKQYFDLGGRDNRKIALKCFSDAAEHGHIESMKWLADCYRYGWGTAKDSYQDRYWRDKYERSR